MMFENYKLKIENLRHENADRGVVALITSIIVGLLLIVITAGAISLMGNELRNAADFDQSVKAFYAAEAGIEDTLAKIRADILAGNQIDAKTACAPFSEEDSNLSGDGVVSYTCQLIDTSSNTLVGELAAEEAVQIDLSGMPRYTHLFISWNQRGSSDPQSANPSTWQSQSGQTIPPSFPSGSAWVGNFPAVLETTLVQYPQSPEFDSSQIRSKTAVIKPSASGSTSPNTVITAHLSSGTLPPNPINTRCVPNTSVGGYDCQASFSSFPDANHYFLRLLSRFGSTHYKIEAFNGLCGEGCKVEIPDAFLSIDVTGKAGDVFRRVLLKIPLADQPKVNFVLLANDSICKVLEITTIDPQVANTEFACDIPQ